MFRFAILGLTVLICIVSLSCQTYSGGLQQSLVRANETTAVAALRSIAVAQQTYSTSNRGDYGTFQQLCDGGYLDSRFNSSRPAIKDYVLTMEVGRESEGPYYNCHADPVGMGAQAGRHFFIDSSTVVRVNPSESATATDPVAQP